MQDSELKKLLVETYPIRPGQEERAWAALKARLHSPAPSNWAWIYFPSWRATGVGVAAVLALALVAGDLLRPDTYSHASTESLSPGFFATAFYSKSAKAQVVWLDGMDPATDSPTYLDPTTDSTPSAQPAATPNSL